jgi:hypothetical protein
MDETVVRFPKVQPPAEPETSVRVPVGAMESVTSMVTVSPIFFVPGIPEEKSTDMIVGCAPAARAKKTRKKASRRGLRIIITKI